jgi:hypothetical protein
MLYSATNKGEVRVQRNQIIGGYCRIPGPPRSEWQLIADAFIADTIIRNHVPRACIHIHISRLWNSRIQISNTPTSVPSPCPAELALALPICGGIFFPGCRHRLASSMGSGPRIRSGAIHIARFNGVIFVSVAWRETSCNVEIKCVRTRRVDGDSCGRSTSLMLAVRDRDLK